MPYCIAQLTQLACCCFCCCLLTDECRCSGADQELSQRGNFNWCCNIATPKLKIDRHIDMSKAAFTQVGFLGAQQVDGHEPAFNTMVNALIIPSV